MRRATRPTVRVCFERHRAIYTRVQRSGQRHSLHTNPARRVCRAILHAPHGQQQPRKGGWVKASTRGGSIVPPRLATRFFQCTSWALQLFFMPTTAAATYGGGSSDLGSGRCFDFGLFRRWRCFRPLLLAGGAVRAAVGYTIARVAVGFRVFRRTRLVPVEFREQPTEPGCGGCRGHRRCRQLSFLTRGGCCTRHDDRGTPSWSCFWGDGPVAGVSVSVRHLVCVSSA
jgi:hypothetical protein